MSIETNGLSIGKIINKLLEPSNNFQISNNMKFIVPKTILLNALNLTGKCIGKSQLPILDNYLFKIDSDKLQITGSNLEIFLTKEIAIEGKAFECSFAILKSRLLPLISELPEQPLTFRIEKSDTGDKPGFNIYLAADCGTYKIPVIDGADFPRMPNYEEIALSIESEMVMAGVNKTLFACGADLLRPALSGLLFSFFENKLTLTGTNAHVLSTVTLETEIDKEQSFIVPARVLAILQSIPAGPVINILLDSKGIVFKIDDTTVLRSRLIDDRYPDYKAVIPKDNDKFLKVDREDLTLSLKRVSLFSELGDHSITMEMDQGDISISCENQHGETARETMATDYTGEPIAISIDGKMLASCLSKIEGDDVWLSFSKPTRAMLVTEVEPNLTGENLILVMPKVKLS